MDWRASRRARTRSGMARGAFSSSLSATGATSVEIASSMVRAGFFAASADGFARLGIRHHRHAHATSHDRALLEVRLEERRQSRQLRLRIREITRGHANIDDVDLTHAMRAELG